MNTPVNERKSESEVTQLCRTLSDPMECSPPGSSVHGIFQARVLEWGAIAFSYMLFQSRFWKWNKPINILLQRNRSCINSRSFVSYRKEQLKHYHAHTYTSTVRKFKTCQYWDMNPKPEAYYRKYTRQAWKKSSAVCTNVRMCKIYVNR